MPEEIRRRPPTTDTWSLAADAGGVLLRAALRSDGPLPLWVQQRYPGAAGGRTTGLPVERVEAVWADIESKRRATRYLHEPPLLVEFILPD